MFPVRKEKRNEDLSVSLIWVGFMLSSRGVLLLLLLLLLLRWLQMPS